MSRAYVNSVTSRGRRYYYFKPPKEMLKFGHRVTPLGKDYQEAKARALRIVAQFQWARKGATLDKSPFPKVIRKMVRQAKQRARLKKLDFLLTPGDVMIMLGKQDFRCAITGRVFDLERDLNKRLFRRPFAPSLDRLDNSLGYSVKNCRLVCTIANYAMGEWGEGALYELVDLIIHKRTLGKRFAEEPCKAQKQPCKDSTKPLKWWAQQDSNLRPAD